MSTTNNNLLLLGQEDDMVVNSKRISRSIIDQRTNWRNNSLKRNLSEINTTPKNLKKQINQQIGAPEETKNALHEMVRQKRSRNGSNLTQSSGEQRQLGFA